MKHLLLILILTACSGGEFNAGMAITHDSGTTVLDSMRGGDAATTERLPSRVALTDGAQQYGDSGTRTASADSGSGYVGRESGSGITRNPNDSGTVSKGGSSALSDASYDAARLDGAAGSTGLPLCGGLNHSCPCCRGYTCQLGRCL
jgi:hypothetical protein